MKKRPLIQYESDFTPTIEVMTSLMPRWADTLMVQVQSRSFPQPVFWPVRLFSGVSDGPSDA